MEKFYMVVSAEGKSLYARHIAEFDKAEKVAKKAVADTHQDAFILTTTHIVVAPTPDLAVTPIA